MFTTDKQTIDDLNIFGKHANGSLFNIFNRCATRGGAAILEEMFRYPLSHEKAINERSDIIRAFSQQQTSFPFASDIFDSAESYLSVTDERTKLSAKEVSVTKKLTHMIAPDTETANIYRGVNALVDLFKGLNAFITSFDDQLFPSYVKEKDAFRTLLSEPQFQPILEVKGKLSHQQFSEFDVVLRFRHRDTLKKILRHVYYLDVYTAVAKIATEKGFSFPKALPAGSNTIKMKGVFHPMVKNAVDNNITTSSDSNIIFLTGANMAGKSTLMKSISIALYIAHMGFPVPANEIEFSVFDGIYTTINLPDNLGIGASHFYAEVLRLKKIAYELSQDRNIFVVFDELFRGTNVKDAYEATIEIVKAFASKPGSTFIISTHIIEAGEVLREACDNLSFRYMPTKMNGTVPVYTYKVETGITDDRHGMVIINNEGILEILESGIGQKQLA